MEGSYDIPYRSYCVKGFKNLLVGGRCMGASKLAMSSTRVMGTCAIGGQAIGTAAALLTAEKATDIRAVDIRKLQQTLLRDDCYLPLLTAETDGRIRAVSASSEEAGFEAENLLNGINRALDGASNAWHSRPMQKGRPERLRITLDKTQALRGVQLVFDSNFAVEKKITLSSTRQKQQQTGVPKELVRDFELRFKNDGKTVDTVRIEDNCQRLVRVPANLQCDELELDFFSTQGDPCVRVFEVALF